MTPEEQIQKMQSEIESLQREVKKLKAASTIPLEVDVALRDRLGINTLAGRPKLVTSTKGATTENQAVSEAGAGSYSVLKPPDAFLQVVVSGTTYYVPVYT